MINNLSSTLFDLTSKMSERKHLRERGELMKQFMETINLAREGTVYKPLSMPRIGVLLKGKPTNELYPLLARCKESSELVANRRKFATEEAIKQLDTPESAFSKTFFYLIRK